MDDVVLFSECSFDDHKVIGKKAAYVCELYSKGFNVPTGFVITGNLFVKFIELSNLKERIAQILISDSSAEDKSLQIQQVLLNTPFPEDMAKFLYNNYLNLLEQDRVNEQLVHRSEEPYVALRVSSTSPFVEDAFFLNIKGKDRFINGIKSCWASLFTAKNLPLKRFKPSVIVQKMINPLKSGIAYTVNPLTNNPNEMFITIASGLGNIITLGQSIPSGYLVDKSTLSVKKSFLHDQHNQYILSLQKERTEKQELGENMKNIMDDFMISEIAKLAMKVESRTNDAQAVRFAIDKQIYVIGTNEISFNTFKQKYESCYDFAPEVVSEPVPDEPEMDAYDNNMGQDDIHYVDNESRPNSVGANQIPNQYVGEIPDTPDYDQYIENAIDNAPETVADTPGIPQSIQGLDPDMPIAEASEDYRNSGFDRSVDSYGESTQSDFSNLNDNSLDVSDEDSGFIGSSFQNPSSHVRDNFYEPAIQNGRDGQNWNNLQNEQDETESLDFSSELEDEYSIAINKSSDDVLDHYEPNSHHEGVNESDERSNNSIDTFENFESFNSNGNDDDSDENNDNEDNLGGNSMYPENNGYQNNQQNNQQNNSTQNTQNNNSNDEKRQGERLPGSSPITGFINALGGLGGSTNFRNEQTNDAQPTNVPQRSEPAPQQYQSQPQQAPVQGMQAQNMQAQNPSVSNTPVRYNQNNSDTTNGPNMNLASPNHSQHRSDLSSYSGVNPMNGTPTSNFGSNPSKPVSEPSVNLNYESNSANVSFEYEEHDQGQNNGNNPAFMSNNVQTKSDFMNRHMPENSDNLLSKVMFSSSMTAVSCDLAITAALRNKYKNLYGREAPDSFNHMIAELKQRMNIPNEREILYVKQLRNLFLSRLKELSPEEVQNCLGYTRNFLNNF